mgnify:CR=1 FL=1
MGNKEKGNVRKMGMAASQVRFLSLQNRKNTIGLNLMTLSNRKTALSRDMSRVANEYNNAMNQKTLKWSNDSGVTYSDLTYDKLMKPNELNTTKPYIITDAQGRVVLDDSIIPLENDVSKVTYRDLAMMISSYSGHDTSTGKATYNNVGNLNGGTDKAESGSANTDNEYQIVTSSQNMVTNSLRYEIMSKLGLISSAEKTEILNKEKEIYGSNNTTMPEGGYPVDSLMGQYYLALAHYQAYENFLMDGDYEYSSGNTGKKGKKALTSPITSREFEAIDGTGNIKYTNSFNATSSNVSFDGVNSAISNVNLEGVTQGKTNILTTGESSLSYSIKDGKIQYSYDANSLLSMMGTVDTSEFEIRKSDGGSIDGNTVKNMTWQEIIANNYAIGLHYEINDKNCERSDYESKVRAFIKTMAGGVANASTNLTLDTAALDKAEQSTEAFFLGDITNDGNKYSDKTGANSNADSTKRKSVGVADNVNLVGESWKNFGALWHRASHATSINAQNVYNTLITFYQYYVHTPNANAIVDKNGGTFEAGTATNTINSADSIETGITYDESKNKYFQQNGQWYVRKESTQTGKDPETNKDITTTVYHYFKTNASGADAIGNVLQEDIISSEENNVARTIRNADGTYSNYEMAKSSYSTSTKGKEYIGSDGWVASSNGSSGQVSGDKLVLKYTDDNGNEVTMILANMVSDSQYANTISASPADGQDQLKKLKEKVDEAAAAKDAALKELDTLFAEKDSKIMDYFDALFKMISQNGWVYDENVNNQDKQEESKNYLNAKLQNNMYFITEVETLDGKDFNYATKLATNVSKVFQVYDTDAQNTALSKYESEKADINAKEKQIDIRMNKLETEQDAIKTELDSIKSIIKDNVDSTFKIFTWCVSKS